MSGGTRSLDLRDRVARFGDGLAGAFRYPLGSAGRVAGVALVAAVTFVVLVLSTFPVYTLQMLGAGVREYLVRAFVDLLDVTYASIGPTGVALVVAYAVATGVAVVNAVGQLRLGGTDLSNLGGAVPGLLASGCAGCGAGVLGLLGFTGALALMPFHGDLLRVGGLLLLVFFLGRSGDPRTCQV